MAHTRLAHGLARRPGRSGFGGLAGLSHLTRQQMEGQLVAGWPRMVERPRESASRTTSVRGLISPGPDRRVPESITRPSPRPVAWGLLPSDEPAARTGRQAHHPGRHGTAPTTGWLGMSSWRPPRSPWLRRFPSCFPGPCRPRPEQRGGSSVEGTNAGGRTAPPTFADSPPPRLSEVCRRGRTGQYLFTHSSHPRQLLQHGAHGPCPKDARGRSNFPIDFK